MVELSYLTLYLLGMGAVLLTTVNNSITLIRTPSFLALMSTLEPKANARAIGLLAIALYPISLPLLILYKFPAAVRSVRDYSNQKGNTND